MNPYSSLLVIALIVLTACSPANSSTTVITEDPEPVATLTVALTPGINTPAITNSTLRPPDFGPNIILYRGNAQRTGLYDEPAIRQLPEIQWQSKVSSIWLMPPLVADDILYTGGGDGSLYALDIQTGEEIWSASGFGQMESTGAIAGDLIVSGGYSKQVQALDRRNGEVVWTFNTSHVVQASPLIVEGRVFIATDHATFALDLQTGELIWETATGEENAFMGAPAIEDNVIYTTGGKVLLALDSETGDELWRVENESQFTALALANGLIYVGNFDQFFRAYDQATGEERWKFEGSGLFWSAPSIAGDIVYAGNDDQIYALDARTGELLWSYKTDGIAVSEPVIVDDVIYVSDSSHELPRGPRHLYALDSSTGNDLWVFETISTFLPAPAVRDGTIYVTTRGEVFALR